ncbi:hypothetical protein JEQ12_010795 [Ovis aries]|uniref:p21-activated protein kinase-interacting protein 1 n=1 Tax=Ovis aries TaxID=9940 RepID=A0A835ZU13_SHEEP|nr:hypothetical protein JEQ12_010795 [Ovis aries]
MEVVAGCYEQVLFGFAVHPEPEADGHRERWAPVADFTHHAHTASLSAVAVNSRFVVTGSKDETIHIYDMKKKVDHGALMHHNGTITCLKFHGNRHLISGAEDGLICVWDVRRWECLKAIRAHKGHVTFLSIHPSGKLALSVGTDKTLRTWNLVEGRSAFIKNIKQNAHIVEWSPKGEKYVVVILNRIDVYQLDTASVSGTITNARRVSSVAFLSESVLAVAGDEEVVRFFDCDSLTCLSEFKAHENRVKDMFSFETPEHRVLVTASSDGFIKMWKLKQDKLRPRDAENAPQHFRRDRDSPPGGEYALVDLCGQTFGKEGAVLLTTFDPAPPLQVQAWFGESEREQCRRTPARSLVASGGIIGYAKAGSVPSLAAGLLFGGLAGLGSYQLSQDPKNVWLFLVTSGTLAGIMGMRFYNSRKFMPAGLIAGASLLMVVKLGISALGKPHQ